MSMKMKMSKLLPNPFRDIGNYPINQERVDKLKGSIKNTKFWGGIVCRPHPTQTGKYELAFGHHRIQALKELKHTEVSIKVFPYSDTQMLQAMAEENREIGQHDVKIMIQTIRQVKLFLDEELAKCKDWATSGKFARGLFDNQKAFETSKGMGVGRDTILTFLGKTWNEHEIKFALSALKKEEEKTIDVKALEEFPNKYQATEFQEAVLDEDVPFSKQKTVAKKTVKKMAEVRRGGRSIKKIVKDIVHPPKPKPKPEEEEVDPQDALVEEAEGIIDNIKMEADSLTGNIALLKKIMKKVNPERLVTLNTIIAGMALQDLITNIQNILKEKTNDGKQHHQLSGTVSKRSRTGKK